VFIKAKQKDAKHFFLLSKKSYNEQQRIFNDIKYEVLLRIEIHFVTQFLRRKLTAISFDTASMFLSMVASFKYIPQ